MAFGRPVRSCSVQISVGFGKGKRLRGSPMRRSIDLRQAEAAVVAATASYFPGFTMTPTRGVFFREGEPGVSIGVVRTQYDAGTGCAAIARKARCLASDLRAVLRQHSVLVVVNDPGNRQAPMTADIVTRGAAASCPRRRSSEARRAASAAAKRTI